MGQTESCSAPPYAHPQAKLVPGTSAATSPRSTASPKVQHPRAPSLQANVGLTAAWNDDVQAYPCTVCDHEFESNDALQEHLLTYGPGYIRPPATVSTPSQIVPESLLSGYCWVCDRAFGTKLEKHLRLSALHKLRSIHPLPHNGRYRPDLWCNMCEVQFTHTDRKRKHVHEMHTHNSRLEQTGDAAAHHTMSSSHVSVTISPAEGLHYCRPCDRYFSTAEELQQHQGLENCGNESRQRRNANVRPSRAQLAPLTTSAAPPPTPRRPSSRSPARPATEPNDVEDPFLPPPSYESILAEGPSPPHEREQQRPSTSRRPRLSDPNPDHLLPALPAVSPSRELPPAPPSPPPKDLRPGLRPSRSALSLQHPAFECALCLEQETNVSALACGHIFGTSCINDALRDDRRCPICREPANVSDLRRIFLT